MKGTHDYWILGKLLFIAATTLELLHWYIHDSVLCQFWPQTAVLSTIWTSFYTIVWQGQKKQIVSGLAKTNLAHLHLWRGIFKSHCTASVCKAYSKMQSMSLLEGSRGIPPEIIRYQICNFSVFYCKMLTILHIVTNGYKHHVLSSFYIKLTSYVATWWAKCNGTCAIPFCELLKTGDLEMLATLQSFNQQIINDIALLHPFIFKTVI